MKFPIVELPRDRYPPSLLEIPEPPERLYLRGKLPPPSTKLLCVVGARQFSDYGREVCEQLIAGLAGHDLAIVSGLALGIDSIAHTAALRAGLSTLAMPGSGLNPKMIYPAIHQRLAERILEADGALLSEFAPDYRATVDAFPRRNRLMAGLSDATLIIEADRKSGTMITARLATDYNKEVLTVPGSIFSKNSSGPHFLIQTGATPITSAEDILDVFGMKSSAMTAPSIKYRSCSEEELKIIEQLASPLSREELLRRVNFPISQMNSLLTVLELKSLIKEAAGEIFLI
ncbi:MAG TPA: DNA-processing protein DprA [Candidatus Paceibacterota bacterium]|nr:DNA-processing protein DprA [Candidatus Paceibacterota bacterium]